MTLLSRYQTAIIKIYGPEQQPSNDNSTDNQNFVRLKLGPLHIRRSTVALATTGMKGAGASGALAVTRCATSIVGPLRGCKRGSSPLRRRSRPSGSYAGRYVVEQGDWVVSGAVLKLLSGQGSGATE